MRHTIRHDIKRLQLMEIGTGGGCTALAHTWKQHNLHCLVTDCNAQAPRRRGQHVLIGFYNNETGEQIGPCVQVRGIENIRDLVV